MFCAVQKMGSVQTLQQYAKVNLHMEVRFSNGEGEIYHHNWTSQPCEMVAGPNAAEVALDFLLEQIRNYIDSLHPGASGDALQGVEFAKLDFRRVPAVCRGVFRGETRATESSAGQEVLP